MIEVAAGLAIADQTVKTFRGVLGLLKDTREAVKKDNPEVADALGEVREAINDTLDQLINLKAQHLELAERNAELEKSAQMRENFTLKQIAVDGTGYAYLPNDHTKHPEDLMLCQACFEDGRQSPLAMNNDRSFAECQTCKRLISLRNVDWSTVLG